MNHQELDLLSIQLVLNRRHVDIQIIRIAKPELFILEHHLTDQQKQRELEPIILQLSTQLQGLVLILQETIQDRLTGLQKQKERGSHQHTTQPILEVPIFRQDQPSLRHLLQRYILPVRETKKQEGPLTRSGQPPLHQFGKNIRITRGQLH